MTSSGQLYAFGNNVYGQLGSTATTTPNPVPALVTLPGQLGTVTQVAAGAYHSLAVTSSGQLYAFGYNYYGQLGNATNNATTSPNPTPTLVGLPGAIGAVTQVSAGDLHSLALTSSGQLYAFGFNAIRPAREHDSDNGTTSPNPTPALVSLPGAVGPVTHVVAGLLHSLAVTASGQLYAFGHNQYGQLGSTTNNGTTTANPTPTLVTLPGASGPVVNAAGGGLFTLALTSTGQLYAFGENSLRQLGSTTNNGTGNPNPTPTQVTLPGQVGSITQIGAGANQTLAVTSSGQLYAFGYNGFGELGSATNAATANREPDAHHRRVQSRSLDRCGVRGLDIASFAGLGG